MTEPLQDRMRRLLEQAGADPYRIPIDGPLDGHGYAQVRQPIEVVNNTIVTDWVRWDDTVPADLIHEIVATFDEYHAALHGPIGRPT